MPLLIQYQTQPLRNKRNNEPKYMAKCYTMNHMEEGKKHTRFVVKKIGKEKRWVRMRGKSIKPKKKKPKKKSNH